MTAGGLRANKVRRGLPAFLWAPSCPDFQRFFQTVLENLRKIDMSLFRLLIEPCG
jgi:hypothetical protein